jgi:hypothetical protein
MLIMTLNRLVLDTLEPLPGDRKCFRMINGVLVERTVKEVVPALKTNSEGLKKVLDDLLVQYKSKQDEMEKWKVCTRLHKRYMPRLIIVYYRRRTISKLSSSESRDHTTTSEILAAFVSLR